MLGALATFISKGSRPWSQVCLLSSQLKLPVWACVTVPHWDSSQWDTGKVHQCLKFIFPIFSSHSLFTSLFTDSLNSFRQIFCVEYRMLPNSQLSLSKIRGLNWGVKSSHLFVVSKKAPVVKACLSFGTPSSGAQTCFSVLTRERVPEERWALGRGPYWHVWMWQVLWQPLLPPTTPASASSSA